MKPFLRKRTDKFSIVFKSIALNNKKFAILILQLKKKVEDFLN